MLSRLVTLALLGWAARALGAENFGIHGFAMSVLAYGQILMAPGLINWGMRDIAQRHQNGHDPGETIITINAIRLVLATVAYVGTAIFAFGWLGNPAERAVVLITALNLYVGAFSANWALDGLERMNYSAAIGLVHSLLSSVVLVAIVHEPDDLIAYAISGPALGLGALLAGYWVLYGNLGVQVRKPRFGDMGAMFRAALPLTIMFALVTGLRNANQLIVRGFLGAAPLGVFLAGFRLLETGNQLPGTLSSVFTPRLSRLAATDRDKALREARLYAGVLMIAAFALAPFMLCEAHAIVGFIYGEAYADAEGVFRVFAAAIVFSFATFGYTNCLLSFNRDNTLLLSAIASAGVSIGGGFLLVPRYGVMGAAWAFSFVDLVGLAVAMPAYRRVMGRTNLDLAIIPGLGAAAAAIVMVAGQAVGWAVWARLGTGTAVYAIFAAWAGLRLWPLLRPSAGPRSAS